MFFKLKYWRRVLGCCRVVVAQWSERRQLRSEALGSIPSGYPCIFSSSILIYHQLLTTTSYMYYHQLLLISIVTKMIKHTAQSRCTYNDLELHHGIIFVLLRMQIGEKKRVLWLSRPDFELIPQPWHPRFNQRNNSAQCECNSGRHGHTCTHMCTHMHHNVLLCQFW